MGERVATSSTVFMVRVYIPSLMRGLTDGQDVVVVVGGTVRDVIDNLDRAYPGVKERLIEDGQFKSSISVAIDGEVTSLGVLAKVNAESEIHFLTAIAGG